MAKTDVYQSIGGLPPEGVQRIIDRLEFRGRDPVFASMREAYLDRMELASRKRVLDLGCGRGLYCRHLDNNQSKTIGIDPALESLKVAQVYTAGRPVPYCLGSGQNLPFCAGAFDAVVCIETLSHIPPEDQIKTVREINRVLRPGGRVIISVHNPLRLALQNLAQAKCPTPFYLNPGLTIYPIAKRCLMNYFSNHGFEPADRVVYANLYNSAQRRFRRFFRTVEDGVRHVPLLKRTNLTLMAQFKKINEAA